MASVSNKQALVTLIKEYQQFCIELYKFDQKHRNVNVTADLTVHGIVAVGDNPNEERLFYFPQDLIMRIINITGHDNSKVDQIREAVQDVIYDYFDIMIEIVICEITDIIKSDPLFCNQLLQFKQEYDIDVDIQPHRTIIINNGYDDEEYDVEPGLSRIILDGYNKNADLLGHLQMPLHLSARIFEVLDCNDVALPDRISEAIFRVTKEYEEVSLIKGCSSSD
jgi:hypothetical protein